MWGTDAPMRLTVVACFVAATLALPGVALAATSNSVTMVSDPGDWVGGGGTLLAMPPIGSISASMTDVDELSVSVSSGTSSYSMAFATADGATMAAGVYEDAQRAPFRQAGHPGIDISGN